MADLIAHTHEADGTPTRVAESLIVAHRAFTDTLLEPAGVCSRRCGTARRCVRVRGSTICSDWARIEAEDTAPVIVTMIHQPTKTANCAASARASLLLDSTEVFASLGLGATAGEALAVRDPGRRYALIPSRVISAAVAARATVPGGCLYQPGSS